MAQLFNTLQIEESGLLSICETRAKLRKQLCSCLFTLFVVVAGLGISIVQKDVPFMILLCLSCIVVLPLDTIKLCLAVRGLRKPTPEIIIAPDVLRFLSGLSRHHMVRTDDLRELVLMPNENGQTLVVELRDERRFIAGLPFFDRLLVALTRLYCGHSIGLTPNLSKSDFEIFVARLNAYFPGRVAVRQQAERPSLGSVLLGSFSRPPNGMPTHLPPRFPGSRFWGAVLESCAAGAFLQPSKSAGFKDCPVRKR